MFVDNNSNNATSSSAKRNTSPVEGDNNPPNSRIFITCGKYVTEEQLYDAFSQFGAIEYCRLLKDKITGNSKGSGFIKFHKASAAAKAIEVMDNQFLGDQTVPLKIQIAYPKGARNKKVYTDEPEDQPPRSRLFVVCPKEMKESTLHQRFKDMEGLEYTKVISDKETGESKGFAFIKFKSASAAALAMESIVEDGEIDGVKVKVLIADPKMKSAPAEYQASQPLPIHPMYGDHMMSYRENVNPIYPMSPPMPYALPSDQMGYYPYSMMYPSTEHYYAPYQPMPNPRIVVTCDSSITSEKLAELFSDCYGVEYCEIDTDHTGKSKGIGYVTCNSPQAASMAINRMHGTEYPPGSTLECSWEQIQFPYMYPFENMFVQQYTYPMYALAGSPPMSYPAMPPPEPCNTIVYNSTKPIPEEILCKLFSNYGPFIFNQQEKENGKGVVTFSNPNAAWCAIRDLDKHEEDGSILSLCLATPSFNK